MKVEAIIFGVFFLIAGLMFISDLSNAVGVCQSGLGKVGSLFSSEVSQNCRSVQTYLYLDYGALVIGGILLILGLTLPSERKNKGKK